MFLSIMSWPNLKENIIFLKKHCVRFLLSLRVYIHLWVGPVLMLAFKAFFPAGLNDHQTAKAKQIYSFIRM